VLFLPSVRFSVVRLVCDAGMSIGPLLDHTLSNRSPRKRKMVIDFLDKS
jgi:hypothetical protein